MGALPFQMGAAPFQMGAAPFQGAYDYSGHMDVVPGVYTGMLLESPARGRTLARSATLSQLDSNDLYPFQTRRLVGRRKSSSGMQRAPEYGQLYLSQQSPGPPLLEQTAPHGLSIFGESSGAIPFGTHTRTSTPGHNRSSSPPQVGAPDFLPRTWRQDGNTSYSSGDEIEVSPLSRELKPADSFASHQGFSPVKRELLTGAPPGWSLTSSDQLPQVTGRSATPPEPLPLIMRSPSQQGFQELPISPGPKVGQPKVTKSRSSNLPHMSQAEVSARTGTTFCVTALRSQESMAQLKSVH